MIPCRFVFRFLSGDSSNSLDHTYSVHAIPRIGDKITMIGDEGSASSVVLDVVHEIKTTDGTHSVIVYYGGDGEG